MEVKILTNQGATQEEVKSEQLTSSDPNFRCSHLTSDGRCSKRPSRDFYSLLAPNFCQPRQGCGALVDRRTP